jgi:ABC-type uncharacterized transport system permease subunit
VEVADMIIENKNIRNRLMKLAVVLLMAAVAELIVLTVLKVSPLIMILLQGTIGVTTISYMVYTAYWVWYLNENPMNENGSSK